MLGWVTWFFDHLIRTDDPFGWQRLVIENHGDRVVFFTMKWLWLVLAGSYLLNHSEKTAMTIYNWHYGNLLYIPAIGMHPFLLFLFYFLRRHQWHKSNIADPETLKKVMSWNRVATFVIWILETGGGCVIVYLSFFYFPVDLYALKYLGFASMGAITIFDLSLWTWEFHRFKLKLTRKFVKHAVEGKKNQIADNHLDAIEEAMGKRVSARYVASDDKASPSGIHAEFALRKKDAAASTVF